MLAGDDEFLYTRNGIFLWLRRFRRGIPVVELPKSRNKIGGEKWKNLMRF
jgi:hypothetical protein